MITFRILRSVLVHIFIEVHCETQKSDVHQSVSPTYFRHSRLTEPNKSWRVDSHNETGDQSFITNISWPIAGGGHYNYKDTPAN